MDGSDGATIDGADGSDDGNAANGMKVVNGRVEGFFTGESDGCVREGDCIGYDDGKLDGAVVKGEFDGSVIDGRCDGVAEGLGVGINDGEVVAGLKVGNEDVGLCDGDIVSG